MAIFTGQTSDRMINGYLGVIRAAEYGRDARSAMAGAVQRCYEVARTRAGTTRVQQEAVTEHTNRIRTHYYGEDVRDALKMGLQLCFTARGISPSFTMNSIFNNLINAQLAEDLKNGILTSIVRCYQEVSS